VTLTIAEQSEDRVVDRPGASNWPDGSNGPGRLTCIVIFIGVLLAVAAEIAAFVVVANEVGFLWAVTILVVVSALGPFVVRRVGFGILAHTRERLTRGELPTRELFDGLVVLVGGLMICVPGFIGDALGLLLMIGWVRDLVIRSSGHRLARRVQQSRTGPRRVVDARSRPVYGDPRPLPRPPRGRSGPEDSATG